MLIPTLALSRIPYEHRGFSMHIDPITVEIIKGALRAAAREMGLLIERTAMSAFIREKKDFFAGVYDPQGRLV
jgi:N-methylhydantoinase B